MALGQLSGRHRAMTECRETSGGFSCCAVVVEHQYLQGKAFLIGGPLHLLQ